MQLINSAIYDKESQARIKAMEETRKLKEQKRTEREQARVLRYAQGPAGAATVATPAQPSASHQILVNDVPFKVAHRGSKLIRISSMTPSPRPISLLSRTISPVLDDPNTANTTPKRVTIAGVAFVRSKHGNLHRVGAVTSKKFVDDTLFGSSGCILTTTIRKPTPVKKRDELCKRFTTTGILFSNEPSLPLPLVLGFGH